jgi:tetratricopeptide (TPR) repeat protein
MPQNAKVYYGLGDALIRKARESGDPSYFDRAEEALKKSLALAPQNGGALRHLAYVFYSRHEFAPAAAHARQAVEIDPEDSDGFGVLGDALMESGQYLEAQGAYQIMIDLAESLYSFSRTAGLKSFRGDSAGAIADLERAIAIGRVTKQPAESVAWAEWQLGAEYFARGHLAASEATYRRSLETYPNYYRALAGMAQVRAAQKLYAEAIAFYQRALAILPMPEYAAALGEVFEKIGKPEQARQQYELVEYIGKLNRHNQALYNRELAYFYADRGIKPKEGLELARRELDHRRDVYAYDVLAWNLYRNGENDQACEAIEKALGLGTQDAKLFYHAGMIHYRLGELAKAKEFLNRALATNPHFHVLFADQAADTLKEIDHSESRMTFTR